MVANKNIYKSVLLSVITFFSVNLNFVEAETFSNLLELKEVFYFGNSFSGPKTRSDAIKVCQKYFINKSQKLEEKGFVILNTSCKKEVFFTIFSAENSTLKIKTLEGVIIFYPHPKLNKQLVTIKKVKELFHFGDNFSGLKTRSDAIKICEMYLENKSNKLQEKGFVVLKSSCNKDSQYAVEWIDNKALYFETIKAEIMFYPNPKL